MKRLVGLLVLVGTLMLGAGLWWLLSRPSDIATIFETPLQETQTLNLVREDLRNSILFQDAEQELQKYSLDTNETTAVGGALDKLQTEVVGLYPSADDSYWLIQTRSAEESEALTYTWYLVDWQQDKLQRLTETFERIETFNSLELESAIWLSDTTAGLTFKAATMPGATPQDTETFHLATLDASSLKVIDVGAVTTASLRLVGGDASIPALYYLVESEDGARIQSKQIGSSQTPDIISNAQNYAYSYQVTDNQVTRIQDQSLEISRIPTLETLATVTIPTDYSVDNTVWWASNGQAFAIVQRQAPTSPDEITKQVSFYTKAGELLHTVDFENTLSMDSLTVYLASNGETALVQRNYASTNPEEYAEEVPSRILYIVKTYAGETEVISGIAPEAKILGVL